jgi:hypothetical protein
MNWGQVYEAGVAGKYCSGYSDLCIYRFTSHFLFPPRNLQGVANETAAILTWEPPLSGDAAIGHNGNASNYSWMQSSGTLSTTGNANNAAPSNGFTANVNRAEVEIFYCGDNGDAIGTGGSAEFMCAARFTNDELYSYYDLKQITKAKIWLATSGSWSNVTVKVWEGGSFGDPGTEVYSEDVTSQIVGDDYTTVTLATPVPLVDGNEYWIGYYVNATGGWPAGCDNGPIAAGKGGWIYFSGAWDELSGYGLNYNWNIIGVLDDAGAQPAGNLASYVLYRDGSVLAEVPKTELEYWDLNLAPDTYCYDITAKYDLTVYGFPGMFAESMKEGTACVDVFYGFPLPFVEDWTTGQFDVNFWEVGQNWIIDGQAGNPAPSAKFKWDPLLSDYESALTSWYLNATTINTTTPYKLWMDYDIKLDDRTASTAEIMDAEVWNGSQWVTMKSYANNGDFDWTSEHIDITSKAKNRVFRIRFNANGAMSGDIFSWHIDNINVYVGYIFNPPLNLIATRQGTPENDIKLTWSAPEGGGGGGTVMNYILDDGSMDNGVYWNGAGEAWLGNEFPVTDAGVLQSASIYMDPMPGASCSYQLEVFDADKVYVGTSAAFTPTLGDWTTVALPDLPFGGTFYVMLHLNATTLSDAIGLDENGPNAASDLEWFYDGSAWGKLTDYGFAPSVMGIRATGLVGDQKAEVTFGSPSQGTSYVSPFGSKLAANGMSVNTGFAQSSADYQGDNADDMTGYNVFRRAFYTPTPGTGTGTGDWTQIGSTPATVTEYIDMNLSNLVTNCYEYYVTAVYTEGESVESNIDSDCIFVGLNPTAQGEVKVYPNPAVDFVNIDLTKEVRQITIYNALGSVITERVVTGESTVHLNTGNYAAGAYSVKFTTVNGDTFSRKFVVTK